MKILGIDPGLCCTGWGVITKNSSGSISMVKCGVIMPKKTLSTPERLRLLHQGILNVLQEYNPTDVALEKVFVNVNGASTLKLGEARGVILMTPALLNLEVTEYTPNTVKKSVTGLGHATKQQVQKMVQMLLTKNEPLPKQQDASDALAVALCHLHHRKY